MSMPADIAAKFQDLIDDWMTGLATIADNIFGSGDNEDKPFVQSNVFFAHCFFRTPWGSYINSLSSISLYWSIDVELEDNDIKFGNLTYLGKDNNTWSESAIADMIAAVKEEYFYVTLDSDGDLYVRLSGDGQFSLYSGGTYYNNKVHLHCDNPNSYYGSVTTNGFSVRLGQCTYTIDAQGQCIPNLSYAQSHPSSSNNLLYAIKNYPIVGNIKDVNNINYFIGAQGAANNYQTTYTTQGGYSFKVYYGDNYIITNAVGDNITYNDVKNAVKVAVDQINDDNDTDMNVPDYPVPPVPPEPEPVTDDYDDMGLGIPAEIATGLSHFAVLTKNELIQLVTDFNTNAAANQSISEHIIGLYRLGVASSELLTTTSDNIVMLMKVGVADFTSNDSYNLVDKQKIIIDLGTIKVDREQLLTNTYYDYAPYTTYEMFIPCCGWVNLPDTIVDRTISVHLLFDLGTCSCKGIVRCGGSIDPPSNGTTIATINGIIGASVPFTINENGLQRGAVISGATQTVAGLAYTGVGAATDNIGLAISGATNALQGLANMYMAGNSSYTSVKGGASDYSIFGDGYEAVLKINRPVVDIPDNFAHTVGYVCNITDQLSNFSGFTVCLNPHVNGLTCTSTEKEEIAKLLEQGVILPAGEE